MRKVQRSFILWLLLGAAAFGQERAGRVVLVPLDDRPAVGQFAQMIGAVADHDVIMPPRPMLGQFTRPGDTARIDEWLRAQDYSRVDALVVSVDMLAYGGLVASRAPATPLAAAERRLEFFRWFRSRHPRVRVYAFGTIMRVAPTADAASRPWREPLARWAELEDRVPKTKDAGLAAELAQLKKDLNPRLIEDYLAARRRNLRINQASIGLKRAGLVDVLVLLQDDARLDGLHRQDQEALRGQLPPGVQIYNGADEGALTLTSRAILDKYRRPVKVAVVYSSEKSRQVVAPYEDRPLQFTVESQIRAAGGRIALAGEAADYTLYINGPETTAAEFEAFLGRLTRDLKANRPAALADVLFPAPHRSGADERIIEALRRERLYDRFTGFAAWNTAGNTLGTAIPHANMRVLFLERFNDGTARAARAEVAHLELLLHRYAGDYLYHDVVRPEVNRQLREGRKIPTDELSPDVYAEVNREVAGRLGPLIEKFFAEQFRDRTYQRLKVTGLRDVKIYLPWARTFEVVIEYRMDYQPNP